MKLKALLFDLDGTLADTDRLHQQAWIEALAQQGIQADQHYYLTQISGGVNPEIVARLLPQLNPQQAHDFIEAKEARFREMADNLEPIHGAHEIMVWGKGKGLELALVSNAPRQNAHYVLDALGMHFNLIVLSDDLGIGKPDPLPYRTALEKLGLNPDQAIAFEDSPSGVKAAVAAGIRCVGISSGHDPSKLEANGVSLLVEHFSDKKLWDWLEQALS